MDRLLGAVPGVGSVMSAVGAGERLLGEVAAAGGQVDGLRVVQSPPRGAGPAERAVYTTRRFGDGEVVMSVPAAVIVPSETLPVAPGLTPSEHHARLALWLVEATGGRGTPLAVDTFVATLPTRMGHVPCLYEDAVLAGTALGERVAARKAALLDELARLPPPRPTAADWLLARAIVTSRAFACGAGEALVPLGDLVNHAGAPGTEWTCSAREGWVLRATRELDAGEELRVSYGQKSNARLLFAYGFTLPDNRREDIEISLDELGAFRLEADADTAEAERLVAALGGLGGGRARRRRALAQVADRLRPRLAALQALPPLDPTDSRTPDVERIRASEARILSFWISAAS